MNSIYVIGNGFDLYHKLKTSYKDFHCFLLHNIDKFPPIGNWSILDLFYQLQSGGTDLWANFEESLGETDFSEFVTFYDFHDSRKLNEKDGDRQTEKAYYLGEDLEELCEKRFYNAISYAMNQWLNDAYHSCPPANTYKQLICNEDDIFINFNYTPTLEDTYKIPSRNILHIHGQICRVSYF